MENHQGEVGRSGAMCSEEMELAKAFSKLEFSGERTEEMCILLSEQPLLFSRIHKQE